MVGDDGRIPGWLLGDVLILVIGAGLIVLGVWLGASP
jgi:hypothetical protein